MQESIPLMSSERVLPPESDGKQLNLLSSRINVDVDLGCELNFSDCTYTSVLKFLGRATLVVHGRMPRHRTAWLQAIVSNVDPTV